MEYVNYVLQNQRGRYLMPCDEPKRNKFCGDPRYALTFEKLWVAKMLAEHINKDYDDNKMVDEDGKAEHVHIVKMTSTVVLENVIV